ncbi:hypothetical protein GUITHDRAFT_112321 [Guillardia theta CCMP2712]|uniref:Uncharacterized protein n=1 Tax=Guillardia theta (strain CCMP2712) TaxID=905079 RepID=L1J0J3_GUITC|nr:hypothetical protein GUITHDRAFT_112321 [Guillardia theta CCMP2712]EKX41615.1 hypothetical protein GUITHDRAFT_112321 [Guillardia theta CCMP2712]|eukprot:XP_005828595.1 hypothetical protein GUITHDRAFT_112321 [Guillardia theta CCMP2712]
MKPLYSCCSLPSSLLQHHCDSVTANKTKPDLMTDNRFDDDRAKPKEAAAGAYQSSAFAEASCRKNIMEQEWAARESMVFSYSHEDSKGSNGY